MSTPDTGTPFRPRSGFETDSVATEVKQSPDGTKARLAGRIMLWRPFGGLVFGHIQDRSGRVQISFATRRARPGRIQGMVPRGEGR